MGVMDEWQSCKYITQCAFEGSGYKQMLTDATYAAQNTQINLVLYSQLS